MMKQSSHQLMFPEPLQILHESAPGPRQAPPKLLETFFNSTLTAVALLDPDFNFLRVNDAYARSTGRDAADFPGHNHFEFYPSDAEDIFRRVRDEKHPCEVQARPFTFPDHPEWGVTYWDWTLVPVLDDHDQITLFVLSLQDATERTLIAREGEATVALLRMASATDSLPDLASDICDFLKSWCDCEAIALRLRQDEDFPLYHALGLPDDFCQAEHSLCGRDDQGRLLRDRGGRPLLQCFCGDIVCRRDTIAPGPRTSHGSFASGDLDDYLARTPAAQLPPGLRGRCLKQGYKSLAMIPLRLGNHTVGLLHLCHSRPHAFPAHMVASLERLGEGLAVALAHRQQATDLCRRDQQYHNLAESVSCIVVRTSPDGVIRFCNNHACDFFGYDPAELIGRRLTDTIVPPVDSQGADLEGQIQSVLANPEHHRTKENENITRSGERVWVRWTNEPIYDEAGAFIELLSIGTDLTPHKRSEQQLLDYQEKLRSLATQLALAEEQERHRVSDAIHDDIVQDLAFCKMRLAMLGQQSLEPGTASIVAELTDSVIDVIQRLRTLSFELSPSVLYRLGLAAAAEWLAERMVERYDYKAQVRANLAQLTLPQDLEVIVYQALRELLVNAGKHAQAQNVLISLDAPNDTLMVEVTDDGLGFDYQSLHAPNREGGYGLFSLQERLTHLGGRLLIESTPQEGTRVLLLVPLRNHPPSDQPSPDTA